MPSALVEELRYLEIHTTRKITSRLTGAHASPFKGVGFDFWEHRRYEPGEDVRRIDWNVTARLGQIHVKLDHDERELVALIVVDRSRSMEFSSTRLTKSDLALRAAGCIAFSAVADQMQLGMVAFTDRVEDYLHPRRGRRQAWRVLEHMWRTRAASPRTDLGSALDFLAPRLRRTTLVFVVSDFLELDAPALAKVQLLAHRHDVIPIVVADPLEEALPSVRGHVRLRDLETGEERVVALSRRSRRLYAQEFQMRRRRMMDDFYAMGLEHVLVRTGDPFVEPLIRLFSVRRGRRR